MKKKLVIFVLAVVLLAASVAVLASCTPGAGEETELDIMKKLITFQQTGLMTARDDSFELRFTCGINEENYTADGAVGTLSEFAKLKLVPRDYGLVDKTFSYEVVCEKGNLTGEFTKDSLGIGFTAQLGSLAETGMPKKVTVKETANPAKTYNLNLESKMAGLMSAEDALQIAMNEFTEQITAERGEGIFNREITVKLLNDSSNFDSQYFWYVSFVAADFDRWDILIEPLTGKVINKRI